MPDILLRDVPDGTIQRLDELAHLAGQSRNAYLLSLLSEQVGDFDPDLVLGFVRLSGGEVDPETDCPECGQPLGRDVFLGFRGDLRPFGPVCRACATTE